MAKTKAKLKNRSRLKTQETRQYFNVQWLTESWKAHPKINNTKESPRRFEKYSIQELWNKYKAILTITIGIRGAIIKEWMLKKTK